ncbi:phosphoglycerate dehydrogenase [Shimia marina]|uniref:D-3-phosphoglycerate dehydrogenase n=1 Tax=Shimia marina TaxID=321267 RepID=A0A0P1EMI7_9RHOB|nr:phosphoglycerate dehydrogenase [Shimia marina]CUH51520.1 D-3-phosphoglycerate dehydrogenase [Shimia marina]SFD47104.1 D-3-phosphoglycerate dehydrogenase [Shimia marina]
MKDVLVTCPPMLGQIDLFYDYAAERGLKLHPAQVTQILSEDELCEQLPNYDGWIIGDDPATRRVFETAQKGRLSAAVKWGIGVDNVDFEACKDLGIPIINTPMMFGSEVADVAVGFVIGLARELFLIDRGVRAGNWPKPAGISLINRRVGVIGLGDIGRNVATRLQALGMTVVAYDPGVEGDAGIPGLERAAWPEAVEDLDFLVFTCALNKHNFHMLDADVLSKCKAGVRVVNVARGPLIDEAALVSALQSGHVHSAALDVFEVEPLPMDSPIRGMERCILGTHNGSNTVDAVIRATHTAIDRLAGFY